MSQKYELKVIYDDGVEEVVVADQRDCSKWEQQPFGCSTFDSFETKPVTFSRFLAYSALSRAQKLRKAGLSFVGWGDSVEAVEFVSEEEADPTQKDQPGTD